MAYTREIHRRARQAGDPGIDWSEAAIREREASLAVQRADSETATAFVIVRTLSSEEWLCDWAGAFRSAETAEAAMRKLADDPSQTAAYSYEVRGLSLQP